MSFDASKGRKALLLMVVGTTLAMLAAAGFAYGHFAMGIGWMLPAFVVAIAAGVGGQIWFIVAVTRTNRGA